MAFTEVKAACAKGLSPRSLPSFGRGQGQRWIHVIMWLCKICKGYFNYNQLRLLLLSTLTPDSLPSTHPSPFCIPRVATGICCWAKGNLAYGYFWFGLSEIYLCGSQPPPWKVGNCSQLSEVGGAPGHTPTGCWACAPSFAVYESPQARFLQSLTQHAGCGETQDLKYMGSEGKISSLIAICPNLTTILKTWHYNNELRSWIKLCETIMLKRTPNFNQVS